MLFQIYGMLSKGCKNDFSRTQIHIYAQIQ